MSARVTISDLRYPEVSTGFQLAKDLMAGENYDPLRNGGAKTGSYGFLHEDNLGVWGAAYDFPYEGQNSLTGRVQRGYAEWLDGLAEATGAISDEALRDATAIWLSHLVFYRPIDKRLGLS